VITSIDSGSGALSKISYLPYGKSASASGSFGYTAQRIDPETNGLYYYRARHYMPVWGRFLQPDPIGYAGSNHLYAYVNNDPLNNIDPFGLDALVIVGGQRSDSYNVFGHIAIAVTGGGIFSFGNGTSLGSSVSAYKFSIPASSADAIYNSNLPAAGRGHVVVSASSIRQHWSC
jgi:RHS repeat-associated protein